MHWLQKLISADAPEHASLHSASLSLRGILPWWCALLIVLAIAAGVGFLYTREVARFGLLRRVTMILLRTAAIALLLDYCFVLFWSRNIVVSARAAWLC